MKISFTKPKNLDGLKLLDELTIAGVNVDQEFNKPRWIELDCDGLIWIYMDEKDKSKATTVVAAHNA